MGAQGGGCIGVLRIEDRRVASDFDRLLRLCDLEGEIDGLLLTKGSGHGVVLLPLESLRLDFHGIHARLELREVEIPFVIGLPVSPKPRVLIHDGHFGVGYRGARGIANLTDNRTSCFTLGGSRRRQPQQQQNKNKHCKSWPQHGRTALES